jgi:hypothetical protein
MRCGDPPRSDPALLIDPAVLIFKGISGISGFSLITPGGLRPQLL